MLVRGSGEFRSGPPNLKGSNPRSHYMRIVPSALEMRHSHSPRRRDQGRLPKGGVIKIPFAKAMWGSDSLKQTLSRKATYKEGAGICGK